MNQFLKFEPILKTKIWGGEKLKTIFGKTTEKKNIGESWEVSGMEGNVSVVTNGTLKGKSLKELLIKYKSDLVGNSVFKGFGENFPLLIKYIDAKETLSIQLHPHDELAKKRHDSFGKTEMWYVMQADEKANLIVGFKKDVSKEEYLKHLQNKSLTSILNIDTVQKGDAYFIPTGCVHAIGAGVLLAEIQQTSDITYRIYDWDRQDVNGNYRDLHTEEAVEAIDYTSKKSYKTVYRKIENTPSEMISCSYFTTNMLLVNGQLTISHYDKDSFVIYMCMSGSAIFQNKNTHEKLKKGETILVPNCLKEFVINTDTKTELLEVYIK
ncbi:MAG: mannose-6-phosphate isomerase [Flavobacteriaceae bacterium]|nr:MAG: mannose-6-phosphate isomerase [Flavobacteriaceae bacterium]